MKSIKQLQDEEEERRREFAAKIKKMKARETTRLVKIAESVKLTDHAVTDADLAAGLRHAIELSSKRAPEDRSDSAESARAGTDTGSAATS